MNQNLWGNYSIGEGTKLGSFVDIAGTIGKGCKIQSFVFIPPGVKIGDRVFVGPHTCFTNHKQAKILGPEFQPEETIVEDDVVIGANCTILPVRIGKGAFIGAGSVVTKDVKPGDRVCGNPARSMVE